MATRSVYGNTFSSNGWPMVDPGSCTWVKVPGTAVTLQIQNGWPLAILRAFAADFSAYVETLRDADSACWTATNSVSTSNHLSGTAMDLNWNSHPFQIADAGFDADEIAAVRDILAFYEGMVFWGNDWGSPKDAMHFQLSSLANGGDIDTHNNPAVGDFIARKVRADGFSTFRRGGTITPPAPASAVDQVGVLARATGVTTDKAAAILPTVLAGLKLSDCTNVNRIAMWLAQMGHESASFVYTEEIQSGDESTDRWLYKGRTWIQITWKANYAQFSRWLFDRGLISTPTYFVDRPKELAQEQWAGIGPAWYWTVARPQINGLCDAQNLVAVTQAINGGQNGAADRKTRYDRALALGDQLLALTTPIGDADDMAKVPQDQWDRVYRELTQLLTSRSPLRHLGEGAIDTMAGFVLNTDGSEHVEICRLLAGYGHPPTLALLREVAGADPDQYPDRLDDAKLAQAILADVAAPAPALATVTAPPTPVVVTAPSPAAAATVVYRDVPESASTGQIIGQAYDALEALQLSGALTDTEKAPLAALIAVLQTKTGASA